MRGTRNIFNLFRTFVYRTRNRVDCFNYYGLHLFLGKFGSGKTASCVNLISDILKDNPKCCFTSNVDIKNISNDHFYSDNWHLVFNKWVEYIIRDDYQNGTIILIDEVQTFFSELLSNESSEEFKIFFNILSQLRKLNCYVILTSQLYRKVQKILRDYILLNGQIVDCKCFIPGSTVYYFYDMDSVKEDSRINLVGDYKSRDILIHTPELYEAYDSFAVVCSIKDMAKKLRGFNNG